MCKVFAYQNPSMHFDSLYTSLHFVQQCLAPQQYVSCWLRFIALQTFLSSEKAPVGQIRCGPVGRQTAAQESCSNHFGMLLSVGLVVAVAAVSFFSISQTGLLLVLQSGRNRGQRTGTACSVHGDSCGPCR